MAVLVMTAAAVATAALVPGSRMLAARLGAMDAPGPRKIHATPTPRLGGVALFAGFNLVVWAGYLMLPYLSAVDAIQRVFGPPFALLQEAHRVEGQLFALFAGSTLVFVVGLADDLLGTDFPVWAKVVGQAAAAVVLMSSGVVTSLLPFDWMNQALTLFWLVGITNAFNLLDNMDGLSAGVAFAACAVLLINAWSLGAFFISLLLVAFMGCLLGFLFFNFHPASVFLGDCGSLFIGYVLASLTLLERYVTHASSTLFPVLMPVMVCAVPLVDTATVVFIRVWERRPIYVGDARHLSHRLVSLGFHQRSAVLILYLFTFSLGLGAASLTHASAGQSFLLLLQTLGFVTLVLVLMFVERRQTRRPKA
ncbi:MAG TPA: MraY family glycosyltransferase [Vicinamibacteria bacterium]|nr:MraY family glycosyltransferase [Vicinamibacteria bacterium]